jgi:hypothetical protein
LKSENAELHKQVNKEEAILLKAELDKSKSQAQKIGTELFKLKIEHEKEVKKRQELEKSLAEDHQQAEKAAKEKDSKVSQMEDKMKEAIKAKTTEKDARKVLTLQVSY